MSTARCGVIVACVAAVLGCHSTPVADTIFLSAHVVTMNDRQPVAEAVAIANGLIIGVGTNQQIQAMAGANTRTVTLDSSTTLLPGFIDPHSHMAGYAFYNDPDHWLDVSSINMYFKPDFVPVRTQDDVDTRLKTAVAALRSKSAPDAAVLAFNYDPSRLGPSKGCGVEQTGFACRNFENGHALEQLDAIATDIPIYVTSESGHIAYVNTPALKLLNICATRFSTGSPACHQPTTNPSVESALADKGQLDEDLSFYSTSYFQGRVLKADKGLGATLLVRAAEIYAQHGYTLVQEGAASLGLIAMYKEALDTKNAPSFPVAAAMIAYDANSADFTTTIEIGLAGRDLVGKDNPLLSVAALKSFADGSTQGYTANLGMPYHKVFAPFTIGTIFTQPYAGLPDISGQTIGERLRAAHAKGFPIIIHQNGKASIKDAVEALIAVSPNAPPPDGTRDVVLHAPAITSEQMAALSKMRTHVALSFLTQNVYFYALPECQQVTGRQNTLNMYPANSAIKQGLTITLHSDTPVTVPYPLFEVWAAKTRTAQQPPWYKNVDKAACPEVMADPPASDERISIRDGITAFTVNAAWQYGMEKIRGSIEVGKYADMVMLSADPFSMENDPDRLKTIRTLGTVRYGVYFPNPNAQQPPIWPR